MPSINRMERLTRMQWLAAAQTERDVRRLGACLLVIGGNRLFCLYSHKLPLELRKRIYENGQGIKALLLCRAQP